MEKKFHLTVENKAEWSWRTVLPQTDRQTDRQANIDGSVLK